MATKVEGDNIVPQPAVHVNAANKTSAGYNPAPKSTYPSDEERAKVQVYIVRQSNITAAINTLSVGAKKLDPEDVIKVAKIYEDHVFGNTHEPMDVLTAFDDLDDLPA